MKKKKEHKKDENNPSVLCKFVCAPRSFQQKLIHHFTVSMYSISPKAIYDIFAMHGRGSTARKFTTVDISFTEPVERSLFIFLWGECCFMILAPIFKPFLKIRIGDLVFTHGNIKIQIMGTNWHKIVK